MEYLRVKNWEQFQHYKDRNPPWIKLHREILNSRTWVSLDDASRVLAIAIMLLASENDNKIPFDPAYIQRRAYLSSEPDFDPLFHIGFIELRDSEKNKLADASKRYQKDSASVSVGISSSKKRKKTSKKRARSIPEDFSVSSEVREWAERKGHSRLSERLEHFRGYAIANDKKYVNWDQAFMNAIRDDWAKLSNKHRPEDDPYHGAIQ